MGQPNQSGTFNNAGDVSSPAFRVYRGGQVTVVLGVFTGQVVLEEFDGVKIVPVNNGSFTAGAGTYTWLNDTNHDVLIRLRYAVKTSGTPTWSLAFSYGQLPIRQTTAPDGTVIEQLMDSGFTKLLRAVQTLFKWTAAKAGATAGWVVNGANDQAKLATLPAAQAASTLVIPIDDLEPGDIIQGFGVFGSVQSGGNATTLTVQLRKLARQANGAAAVDSQIQALGSAVNVTANTALTRANAFQQLTVPYVCVEGESYYLLVTSTTGAACTQELQGAIVDYNDQ